MSSYRIAHIKAVVHNHSLFKKHHFSYEPLNSLDSLLDDHHKELTPYEKIFGLNSLLIAKWCSCRELCEHEIDVYRLRMSDIRRNSMVCCELLKKHDTAERRVFLLSRYDRQCVRNMVEDISSEFNLKTPRPCPREHGSEQAMERLILSTAFGDAKGMFDSYEVLSNCLVQALMYQNLETWLVQANNIIRKAPNGYALELLTTEIMAQTREIFSSYPDFYLRVFLTRRCRQKDIYGAFLHKILEVPELVKAIWSLLCEGEPMLDRVEAMAEVLAPNFLNVGDCEDTRKYLQSIISVQSTKSRCNVVHPDAEPRNTRSVVERQPAKVLAPASGGVESNFQPGAQESRPSQERSSSDASLGPNPSDKDWQPKSSVSSPGSSPEVIRAGQNDSTPKQT